MAKKKKSSLTKKPNNVPASPETPTNQSPMNVISCDEQRNCVTEVAAELVPESAESELVETPSSEEPATPEDLASPATPVHIEAAADGEIDYHAEAMARAVPMSEKYEAVLAQIVSEKRSYDFFVNRISQRLAAVTAGKNRAQNELTELTSSVRALLSDMSCLEEDPGRKISSAAPISASGIRGPPLPSQDELFLKAWDQGQVGSTYSQFAQRRQYSTWKSDTTWKTRY